LARKAISTHGRIDVLVNNAGSGWSGPVTGMTAGDVLAHAALGTAPGDDR
jgi:NAD(P)-dependent dehydrogenase (short-subunit alcohol dehydrogenase family)